MSASLWQSTFLSRSRTTLHRSALRPAPDSLQLSGAVQMVGGGGQILRGGAPREARPTPQPTDVDVSTQLAEVLERLREEIEAWRSGLSDLDQSVIRHRRHPEAVAERGSAWFPALCPLLACAPWASAAVSAPLPCWARLPVTGLDDKRKRSILVVDILYQPNPEKEHVCYRCMPIISPGSAWDVVGIVVSKGEGDLMWRRGGNQR